MKVTDHFNWGYSDVPEHTRESLANYFIHCYEPGSFLMSVLVNDLYGAACRADHINRPALAEIAKWVMHNAPVGSWGSPEAVNGWLKKNEYQQHFEKSLVMKVLSTDYE